MILLNIGCGGNCIAQAPWINIDSLPIEDIGRQEIYKDKTPNYLQVDSSREGFPFDDSSVDGVVALHFLEHLDCHEALRLVRGVYGCLRPGGIFRIGVPDPRRFHELTVSGNTDWGEPTAYLNNPVPPVPSRRFMEYALFFNEHKQLLTKDALFCLLWLGGFREYSEVLFKHSQISEMVMLDTREIFTLFVEAIK